jgi:hypothetical protein
MKLILSAIALAFAAPAAAQTAPAVDHSQHSPAEHARHAAGHDQHKGHEGHGKDGKHAKHDCPMTKDGKKMACCDKHGDHKAAAPAAKGGHAGH